MGLRFGFILAVHAALVMALLQINPDLRRQVAPVIVSILSSPSPVPVQEPAPKSVAPRKEVRPREVARPAPASSSVPEATTAPTAIVEEPPVATDATTSAPSSAAPVAGDFASAAVQATPAQTAVVTPPPPVLPPRFDAAYLNNPRPDYPRAAKRMGEQGKVMLRVYVSASGAPHKVEVGHSSGSRRLDEAARLAVEQWRFVPARQGDVPVAAWVIVPITFALEG